MGVFADTVRALAKAASAPRFPGGWSSIAWRGSSSAEGDWRKIIGDGSTSSIVEACVLWICRNFPEAPAVVVQTGDDAIPQIIRHPFARKIRWPNPYYSGVLLWYGTLTSWVIDGNAYWLKVRDQLGRVVELWYIPHWMIQPRWPLDGTQYISHYEYRPAGELLRLDPADIFHLRYGIDPDNTRKGRSPLRTLFLELGVDHEASHFSAAILKNLGVPGVVISPDKESKGAMDEPAREAIKAKFKQSFGGDNRGDPIVLSKPTNIMQFGFSPAELDLGAIRDIPEERVTAVLGIPAAVVGFGTGLQTAKVGATMSELRDQAYENNIIPTQRLVADEMTLQLLPEFLQQGELLDTLEVAFDLSREAARRLGAGQRGRSERESMRPPRTFTTRYEDKRVRRPEFPLTEAVSWYLEDARGEIVDTTWLTYRCHLRQFIEWLPPSSRTIASVEPETVERFVRTTASNANTRRNKIIAVKSLATHLAKKKIWYTGTECRLPGGRDHPLSETRDHLQAPRRDAFIDASISAVNGEGVGHRAKSIEKSIDAIAWVRSGARAARHDHARRSRRSRRARVS